jgi:hypothetical protein
MRLTQTRSSGRRAVLDPVTSWDSGSCRHRSLNLLVINSRDLRNNIEPGRDLFTD